MTNNINITDYFFQTATFQPEAAALFVDGRSYPYGFLSQQAAWIAGWILQNVSGPSPRVGILASRSFTAYAGVLGAAWAGATYVPLNPNFPTARLQQILEQADVDALICDKKGARLLNEINNLPSRILAPDEDAYSPADGCLITTEPCSKPVKTTGDHVAYIMFTSGTTGQPKGIKITTKNVLHMLKTLQERYIVTPSDHISQFFELSFDPSVFDIFMALSYGASLYVVPDSQLTSPVHFIRKHQISIWSSVPSLIGLLEQMNLLKPYSLPSLRASLFCGEALSTKSAQRWSQAAPNSLVDNLYGNTETTVHCLLQEYMGTDSSTPSRGIVAIGKPLPGLSAEVVDEKRQFLPKGATGELAISGPQVSQGYLLNPPLTNERFPTLNHATLGQSRWYLTGDLAQQDAQGRYHFLGRVDHQVQLRGQRIELDEIEHYLREASGCNNAIALFIEPHNPAEQKIIGVIECSRGDSGEIRDKMRNLVPGYMVPKKILLQDQLPRNSSGKIDRSACIKLLEGHL